MSRNGTATDQFGPANGTPAGETTSAKLKHIGVSLLPLALFMASTLGTEYFTQRRQPSHPNATADTMSPKPGTGSAEIPSQVVANAVKSVPANSQATVQPPPDIARQVAIPRLSDAKRAVPAPDVAHVLRDERSLLELSRLEAARTPPPVPAPIQAQSEAPVSNPTPPPTPTPASGVAAVPPKAPQAPVAPLVEPPVTHRTLATTVDGAEPVPLGFKNDSDAVAGGYAIVRGVPPSAILSHGIAVGDDSWLIDGVDIPRAAIDLRGRATGKMVLELAVLSASSALLQRENVTIEVKSAAIASPATTAPLVPVVNSPATIKSTVESAAVEPAPTAPSTPTAQTGKAAASAAPLVSVRISRENNLVPGRGGLLKLDVGPASAIPPGAYVVVRGLPADTAMSRGIPMGAEAWLLTLAELAELEVRLPARATAAVQLVTKLVTKDGQLIAEDQYELPVRSPVAAVAAQAPAVNIATPAPVAVAAAPAQIVTRAIPAPAPAPVTALAPGQLAFTRARRMLDLGNIAAARPLLQRSASEGSGDAAALLGASFDPDWLAKAGVLGITADPAKARHWYDEARKLGVQNIERATAAQRGR